MTFLLTCLRKVGLSTKKPTSSSIWRIGTLAIPILILQSKEESFVDLADEVKGMIQSSQKHHKKRVTENAYRVLLQELFDVVNRKSNQHPFYGDLDLRSHDGFQQ